MKILFIPLMAALTLGACDILGSSNQLDFQVLMREVESHGPAGPTQTARAEVGRIIATGGFTTHCDERSPTANVVSVSRTQINLLITEQQVATGCTPLDRFFEYDAFIGPLSPGTYVLNIVHHRIGAAAEVVFEEHLTVN